LVIVRLTWVLTVAGLTTRPPAISWLASPSAASSTTSRSRPVRDASSGGYGRQVLADELAALGRATPGHRNRTLNRTAFKVYRYVAGGVLDDQDVTVAFTTVA
jgi:hypothetical protein